MDINKKQFIDFSTLLENSNDVANINSDEFCSDIIQEEYHLLSTIHPDKRKYTTFAKFIIQNTYPLLRNLIVSFDNKENTTKGLLIKTKKHYLPRKFISYKKEFAHN